MLRTIHSGLFPDLWKASKTSKRRIALTRFCPELFLTLLWVQQFLFQDLLVSRGLGSLRHPFWQRMNHDQTHASVHGIHALSDRLVLKWSILRINYHISCEVDNFLEGTRTHVKGQAHTAWNPLEIPDMRYRSFLTRCVPYVHDELLYALLQHHNGHKQSLCSECVCIYHKHISQSFVGPKITSSKSPSRSGFNVR